MNESYLRELEAELGVVGIRGSRRRRILVETADHLRESGDPARFGEPRLIAARFADELATNGARWTALFSFFALAPAGIGYALLVGLNRPGPDITSARTLSVGLAAALVIALAPQISLAAGLLAIALVWRVRAAQVVPAAAISSSTDVSPSRSAQERQRLPVSRSMPSSTAAACRIGGRPSPSR